MQTIFGVNYVVLRCLQFFSSDSWGPRWYDEEETRGSVQVLRWDNLEPRCTHQRRPLPAPCPPMKKNASLRTVQLSLLGAEGLAAWPPKEGQTSPRCRLDQPLPTREWDPATPPPLLLLLLLLLLAVLLPLLLPPLLLFLFLSVHPLPLLLSLFLSVHPLLLPLLLLLHVLVLLPVLLLLRQSPMVKNLSNRGWGVDGGRRRRIASDGRGEEEGVGPESWEHNVRNRRDGGRGAGRMFPRRPS